MDPLRNIPRLPELSKHLKRLSPTDRGSFSTLTSVSDIQAWTAAKAEEYLQFSLALLAIHNLAAPIHRLPTDVLERVFADCWHDRKSLRLSHTCGLWRSIILNKAALWADAATNWGPLFDKKPTVYNEVPFVNAVLSRSARHSGGIKPFFHSFPPSIVTALTPHVGNVVSLRVTLDCQSDLYDGLWPILRSGMPKLDALHIEFIKRVADSRDADYEDDDNDNFGYVWNLLDGSFGSLKILSGQNLPQLSRLACPIGLVRLFAHVPLKRLKIAAGSVHNHIFQ
ncbi:hypothetical protein GSI_07365 [Ganoderma sinense ZZ0214-1]|uniref:Uncharacterized protein n=1 Tax=Ganoderma sinense ZZ0214-1 TaxID=1077348 RepID=A0A2G8SA83_9APHY|nr:hypothetical protein GSI_07365 [Ganoderma sinense ZZ0214-1]